MKKRMLPLATLCILCALVAAQDDAGRSAGSKLLAAENVWNQAEAKGDIAALAMIFDDSLVYVDENGILLTKAQFLLRAKAAGAHVQSLTTESMNAQVYGSTAVVTGTCWLKGIEGGKTYQRDGRFTDIWVYRNRAWLCVAAQSTPIHR